MPDKNSGKPANTGVLRLTDARSKRREESYSSKSWRREGDSNPRYGHPYTRFPSGRLKPLGHLSKSIRLNKNQSTIKIVNIYMKKYIPNF
jgi:hypothetical protein